MTTAVKTRKPKKKKQLKSGDYMLFILVMGLVIFGVVMIFSASYYSALSKTGNPYKYLVDAAMWAGVGTVALLAASTMPLEIFRKFAYPGVILGLILLLLIFTPLGKDSHGAVRWLQIGPVTMMPGEFAKAFAILFAARWLSDDPKRIQKGAGLKGIVPVGLVMVVYVALILKQPNMSTAMTVALILCGMMFVAGLKLFWIPVIGGVGAAACWFLLTMPGAEYRLQRYTSFLDPFADPLGAGYQVVQGMLAMGSGGAVHPENAVPSGTTKRLYLCNHRRRTGLHRLPGIDDRLSDFDLEMLSHLSQCSGAVQYVVGIRDHHHVGGPGTSEYCGCYVLHAAHGDYPSLCQLWGECTVDLHGGHGDHDQYFTSFSGIRRNYESDHDRRRYRRPYLSGHRHCRYNSKRTSRCGDPVCGNAARNGKGSGAEEWLSDSIHHCQRLSQKADLEERGDSPRFDEGFERSEEDPEGLPTGRGHRYRRLCLWTGGENGA